MTESPVMWPKVLASIALIVLIATPGMVWGEAYITPDAEHAEDRVGYVYWARPGIDDTSVDFYLDQEFRERLPVYKKTRFRIGAIEVARDFPSVEISYRVRFDDKREAFIRLADFEKALYHELAPNQVMTAPANSPIGASPHVWIFERSSIFSTDPDIIWERIKNDGPRTFTPFSRKKHQPAPPKPAIRVKPDQR